MEWLSPTCRTTGREPRGDISAPTSSIVFAPSTALSRLTKPYDPWTNGQAERMNQTIKEPTIKVFHYPSLGSLKADALAFVTAYNFAKHFKALRWKTPFEAICVA
jgi:hypothetical protein